MFDPSLNFFFKNPKTDSFIRMSNRWDLNRLSFKQPKKLHFRIAFLFIVQSPIAYCSIRACSLSSLTSHDVWPLQLWVNYYLNLAYPCSEFVRSSYIYIIITTLVYLYLYFILPRVRKALNYRFSFSDNLTYVFYDVIVTLSMKRKSSSSFFFYISRSVSFFIICKILSAFP